MNLYIYSEQHVVKVILVEPSVTKGFYSCNWESVMLTYQHFHARENALIWSNWRPMKKHIPSESR